MKQVDLQHSVMSYLESKDILCIPIKAGMLSTSRGKQLREIGALGLADLLAFYPSERMGIIPVWLEVRSRRSRPTPDQEHFRALVESKKHVYMVVTSVQAAKEFFD